MSMYIFHLMMWTPYRSFLIFHLMIWTPLFQRISFGSSAKRTLRWYNATRLGWCLNIVQCATQGKPESCISEFGVVSGVFIVHVNWDSESAVCIVHVNWDSESIGYHAKQKGMFIYRPVRNNFPARVCLMFILKLCSLQSALLMISKNCSFLCLYDEISFRLFFILCVAKWTLNADWPQRNECPGVNPEDFYVLSATSMSPYTMISWSECTLLVNEE
jgi:hypothetical protein